MEFSSVYFTVTFLLLSFFKSFDGILADKSCPTHIDRMKNTHRAMFEDTCYLFVDKEVFWKEARRSCWELGGEMLMVRDKKTMDFIRRKLNSKELGWRREGVWLGARLQSRRWKWTDGTYMTYDNWARGEPSKVLSVFSVEDCGQMRREDDWKWHDHICGSLNFHYNYICQFSGEVVPTTTTTTTTTSATTSTTSTTSPRPVIREVIINSDFNELKPFLKDKSSSERSPEFYQNLGQRVYRRFEEKMKKTAMAENKEKRNVTLEQATSRVSSSASNQERDNGNRLIVIIVISLTAGFLLILLIIFLLMRRHNQIIRAKAAERAVRYVNNHSNNSNTNRGGSNAIISALSADQSSGEVDRQRPPQPPPVPATRPPLPVDGTCMRPKEVSSMYTEVIPSNGFPPFTTNAQQKNYSCSHTSSHLPYGSSPTTSQQGSECELLGACGMTNEPEVDLTRPLMSDQTSTAILNGCSHHTHNHNRHPASNPTPTESCSCVVDSRQSEYVAMSSLGSKDSIEKLNHDEKHTYSNIHGEVRENIAVENHYEYLP